MKHCHDVKVLICGHLRKIIRHPQLLEELLQNDVHGHHSTAGHSLQRQGEEVNEANEVRRLLK